VIIEVSAQDPEGGIVALSLAGSNLPDGEMTTFTDLGGGHGRFAWTPAADLTGTFEIEFRAADNTPAPATGVAALTVAVLVTDGPLPSEGEGEGEAPDGEEGEDEPIGPTPEIHSGDLDGDHVLALNELLRIIQLHNSGAHHCDAATEDGYAPGTGDQTCARHTSDYLKPYWSIGLGELMRAVQFYNSGGYHVCAEGEDGYCPGLAK